MEFKETAKSDVIIKDGKYTINSIVVKNEQDLQRHNPVSESPAPLVQSAYFDSFSASTASTVQVASVVLPALPVKDE